MNDDARNDNTKLPLFLNNKSTPYTTVYSGAAPTPTAAGSAAASTIVPYDHIYHNQGKNSKPIHFLQ